MIAIADDRRHRACSSYAPLPLRNRLLGREAARREGKRTVAGRGGAFYIHIRRGRHRFVLTVSHSKIHSIAYLERHSV